MESDERPAKMRKLEHNEGGNGDVGGEMEPSTSIPHEPTPVTTEISEDVLSNGLSPDTPAEGKDEAPKISKSQLKKQRRHERWESGREDRKLKRKEKTKEKKARKREAWAQGNTDENGVVARPPPSRPPRHSAGFGTQVPVTIIFDCDFEDLMFENEMKSLGLQITRCYSDNRNAKFRAHLALSSFGGKMKERFDGILAQQYKNWKGFQFFEEDFVAVAEKSKEWMTGPKGGVIAGALKKSREDGEDTTEEAEEGEIVYLSAESDNVLTRLKPNSTYIIGGLVDKNRHKGICHKRAVSRGIKTAKLPIGEFLEMKSRQVLVTNHVMDIMSKWLEYDDWGKAFMDVMPKRKGGKLREDAEGDDDDVEEDNLEGEMDSGAKTTPKEGDEQTTVEKSGLDGEVATGS